MKSFHRVLEVLQQFTVACPQWTLTELSQATGLPITTVHRIVSVLKEHGMLAQDSRTKQYRLGFGFIDLGYRALAALDVPPLALPAMRRLSANTGETVHLTVPSDTRDYSACVARVDGQYDLRIHLEVGRQVPLHAGASAKVLLAYFPSGEIDAFISRTRLPRLAPNSITDPSALRNELAAIRRQGYAFSYEETHVGAWGLAVPILDGRHEAIAAVGISAPISRYSEEIRSCVVVLVREAAEEIARSLGLKYRQSCVTAVADTI